MTDLIGAPVRNVRAEETTGCLLCGRDEGHAVDCLFGKCLACGQPDGESHLPGCLVIKVQQIELMAREATTVAVPIFQEMAATLGAGARQLGELIVGGMVSGIEKDYATFQTVVRKHRQEQKRHEKESRQNFEELVGALRKAGYRVKVNWVTELVLKRGRAISCRMPNRAKIAQVQGKSVRAMFATAWSSVGIEGEITSAHPRFDGQLVAENARCFLKWSQAPMTISLPRDPAEVVAWLNYLGSDEGYNISNGYLYLDENPFPNKHDQRVGQRPQIRIASLDLKPINIHELNVITPRPRPPVLLHGLGDGLRARLLPREEIEAALVEMGVDGGHAAATETQLVQARLNAVLGWGQEGLDQPRKETDD